MGQQDRRDSKPQRAETEGQKTEIDTEDVHPRRPLADVILPKTREEGTFKIQETPGGPRRLEAEENRVVRPTPAPFPRI